ncbi:hypothetical protein LEN26_016632 [Aphanomyces euteiches]|nr:hypothetical protein LEN26_016632 [Aphanomyces euteiches]
MTDAKDIHQDKPRWGKWTKEEEAYTARLIADFTAGLLTDVENGTTMRAWLSTKLHCCPMRISKKFVGEHSIGKRMFERNETRLAEMTDDIRRQRDMDLDKLYADFYDSWMREERERLELKSQGTRKRKRNRTPKREQNALVLAKRPNPPPSVAVKPSAVSTQVLATAKNASPAQQKTLPRLPSDTRVEPKGSMPAKALDQAPRRQMTGEKPSINLQLSSPPCPLKAKTNAPPPSKTETDILDLALDMPSLDFDDSWLTDPFDTSCIRVDDVDPIEPLDRSVKVDDRFDLDLMLSPTSVMDLYDPFFDAVR